MQKSAPCKVIRIPESRKHLLVESGIRKIFDCGIRNPTLWNSESISRNPESRKRDFLEFGTHRGGILNPVRGIRSPHHGMRIPRLSWITLHGVKKCIKIDIFHGLIILLSPFKFARQASFMSFKLKRISYPKRGLVGKFECRYKNI